MSTYKLTYFDAKGLGEPIRFLFAYGDIEYEDVRVNFETWPTIKPSIPWGQLPVLEIDGKIYNQTMALGRYLAAKVGLSGKDELENLQINIAIDTINEYRVKVAQPFYETNAEAKAEKIAELHKTYFPSILPKLDKLAGENNGYFALGRVSFADFLFTAFVPYLNKVAEKNLIADYKNLQKVVENVESIPKIKEWLEKRPVTEY